MYNPLDWYWLADDTHVYSSARQIIVDSADAEYVAWCGVNNNAPTAWPRDEAGNQIEAALQEVIEPYGKTINK